MRALDADAIANAAAHDVSFSDRAAFEHLEFQEPRFAARVASETDHVRGMALRRFDQAHRAGRLVWHERRAARLKPGIDIALFIRDGFDRAEIFDVRGRNRRHQRHMRFDQIGQRQNLAAMIHTDLKHAELGCPPAFWKA